MLGLWTRGSCPTFILFQALLARLHYRHANLRPIPRLFAEPGQALVLVFKGTLLLLLSSEEIHLSDLHSMYFTYFSPSYHYSYSAPHSHLQGFKSPTISHKFSSQQSAQRPKICILPRPKLILATSYFQHTSHRLACGPADDHPPTPSRKATLIHPLNVVKANHVPQIITNLSTLSCA